MKKTFVYLPFRDGGRFMNRPYGDRILPAKPQFIKNEEFPPRSFKRHSYANVAAITALMVCIRFSASSNTMDAGDSNTSLVTSMQSMPNFS